MFMKKLFPLILLFFTASFAAAQKSVTNDPRTERERNELIRLTREISRASVEDDAATLERLMDEKFVLHSVGNKTYGKRDLIKIWTVKTAGQTCTETSVPGDFEIHIFDKTAIVVSTITDFDCASRKQIQSKAFDVWRKTKRGWRWIAARETLLPPANASETNADSPEAVVTELYAALSFSKGQTIDRVRIAALFAPGARLIFAGQNPDKSSGQTEYSVETFLDFAAAKGQASRREEKELWRRVERFGSIAHVYSAYELIFDVGEPVKTVKRRGINSVQLIRKNSKWQIISLIWDVESEGNALQ